MREFRTFTAELQEFFNAGGLRELLQSLIPSLEEGGVAIINTFLAAKAKVLLHPRSALACRTHVKLLQVFQVAALLSVVPQGNADGMRTYMHACSRS